MLLDPVIFLVGQASLFIYYLFGDPDLSDIMEQRGVIDTVAFLIALSELSRDLLRIFRDTDRMSVGILILRVDSVNQCRRRLLEQAPRVLLLLFVVLDIEHPVFLDRIIPAIDQQYDHQSEQIVEKSRQTRKITLRRHLGKNVGKLYAHEHKRSIKADPFEEYDHENDAHIRNGREHSRKRGHGELCPAHRDHGSRVAARVSEQNRCRDIKYKEQREEYLRHFSVLCVAARIGLLRLTFESV